jgi:hypothetical protein
LSFVVVVAAAGRERRESLLMMRFGLAFMSALFDRREYSGEIGAAIMMMMRLEDSDVGVEEMDVVLLGV